MGNRFIELIFFEDGTVNNGDVVMCAIRAIAVALLALSIAIYRNGTW